MAKASFWNIYDHLGGCILLNLLWTVCSIPWLALGALLITVGWGQFLLGRGLLGIMVTAAGIQQLLLSPVSAALWAVTAHWAHGRAAPVSAFFPALRRFFGRALVLWLGFTLVALLLGLNAYFYKNVLPDIPLLGAFVSGIMVWIYLFASLVQIYVLSFLVQEDGSLKRTVRRSLLVMFDNFLYTFVLGFLMSVVLAAGLVSLAGLLFLAVSLTGVIANTGLREVMKRYQPRAAQTAAGDAGGDRRAGEETRGWRDLWKPWES
jgi:uncharacterized membrane protein YesL